MKRLITLLSLTILIAAGFQAGAQSTANYTFTTSTTGSLTDMSSGTTDILVPATTAVDIASSVQNIGFTFVFMGVPYTQYSVNSNGLLKLGSVVVTSAFTNDLNATINVPQITAFWDDLNSAGDQATSSRSKVRSKLTGISPNQVLTVEWTDLVIRYNVTSTTEYSTWQILMYETGKIEFIYGNMQIAATPSSAVTASIGFSTTNADTKVLSITSIAQPTPTVTTLTASVNNSLVNTTTAGQIADLSSASQGSRKVYTFTPPSTPPNAPSDLNFTSVTGSGMTLNWTDNSSDEVSFVILRATDGVNYNVVGSVAPNIVTYSATGLNFGTTYYWKVIATNEGQASSPATGTQATTSPTLSGNKFIPTDYATITAAFNAITNNGLVGNLNLILESTYTSAGETFPIVGPTATSMGSYTVTIYPQTSGLIITSSNSTGTIDLNGSKNIIFDGRVNATGTVKDLVIENTSTSGFTLRFINDAVSNSIMYCILKGVNTSTTSGIIHFSTTTGTTGNDNNIIDYCDIRDGATTHTNGIYASGTSTSASHYNSGITISNCNIFNYYNSTSTSNGGIGINVSSYNADWNITGNSFYQTSSRSTFGSGATTNAILVSSSTVSNFNISNNYVGGSAPQCGGTAYTIGNASVVFRAFQLTMGSSPATSIQGNVIQNISITSSSASTAQSGISLVTGSFNCGTITGNTIGSGSATGSIVFVHSSTSTAPIFSGILAGTGTPGVINISNNSIGGIAVSTSSTATVSTRGISVQGSATSYTISNNVIGSTTTANSITNSTNQSLLGIFSASTSSTNITSNNTIQNLAQTGTTTSNTLRGILVQGSSGGAFSTTGNTVRDLTSTSTSTGTGSSASVVGIYHSAATTAGQLLSQNTVFNLSNTTGSAAVSVIGIYYAGPTSGTNVVGRNFVYGLALSTSSTTAVMIGINVNGGLTDFQNNFIAIGEGQTTGFSVNGINDGVGTNNYYFNSVYIGGSGVGGSASTYAFNSSVTTNNRIFKNNIFFNARSNGGSGTGKHYSTKYGGSTPNPTGLSADNNVLISTGTGSVFGQYNSLDVTNIYGWRAATGQDNNSLNFDPVFNAPTSNPPDLHIHPSNPTPIEGSGTLIASVTDDYDGDTRANFTPNDIGADAGNFNGVDLLGPTILYTLLSNTASTANRSLANVNITDNSGVNTTSGTKPRTYFKRKTDANVWNDNTSSTAGWKWVEATGTSNPFDFTLNYSLLNGGTGVVPGDTIQYFVVAQDLAAIPNVGINMGTFSVFPSTVALPSSAFPISGSINSFIIVSPFNGTINVGTGETYTTLTADATTGLFKAINNSVLSGNLIINITTDLNETGAIALNQWIEEGAGNYTLTIKPSASSARLISGNYAGGLIRFNGADRITIDGLSGRYLTITNSATSSAKTIEFLSSCNNINIKRCNISTGSNSSTSNYCIYSNGDGNNNIAIDSNLLTKSYYGIYIIGTSSSDNTNNSFIRNTIGSPVSADNITRYGIYTNYQTNLSITGNEIRHLFASSNPAPHGIALQYCNNVTISRNYIHDLAYTGTGGYGAVGIHLRADEGAGVSNPNILIMNNVIERISGDSDVPSTSSQFIPTGMRIYGSSTITTGIEIYNNSIYLSPDPSYGLNYENNDWCAGLVVEPGPTGIKFMNNIIYNSLGEKTGSIQTTYGYAIYMPQSTPSSPFSIIDNNIYYVTNFDNNYCGLAGTAQPPVNNYTFAQWQSFTGQEINSKWIDPQYADSLLHLTNPGSAAIGNAVALPAVAIDKDGSARHFFKPTIGAYEYAPTNLWTWTGLAGGGDNAWTTAANWDKGTAPTITDNAYVPADPASDPNVFPEIANGVTGNCADLYIQSGGSVTVQPGGTLNIKNTP